MRAGMPILLAVFTGLEEPLHCCQICLTARDRYICGENIKNDCQRINLPLLKNGTAAFSALRSKGILNIDREQQSQLVVDNGYLPLTTF